MALPLPRRFVLVSLICVFAPLTFGIPSAHAQESGAGQAYEKALAHWAERDSISAVIELHNALRDRPDHVPSLLLIGEIYLDRGVGDAAEDAFRRALDNGADRSRVSVLYARSLLIQRKAQQALDELYFAGLVPTAQAEIHALRAEANVMLSRINDAARELDSADALAPGVLSASLVRVTVHLHRNELDAAQRIVDRLALDSPGSSRVWNAAGSVAHAKGLFETALGHYTRAIDLDPRNGDARIARLSLFIDLGRDDESGDDLEYFANHLPTEPRATYLRALRLARGGDDFGSRQALADTTYHLSNFEDAMFHRDSPLLLVAALAHYGLGQMQQTIRYTQFYLTLRGEDVGARKLLADALIRVGQPVDAIKTLEPAMEAHPNDLDLLALAATAYGRYGRFLEASKLLSRAISLDESDVDLRARHATMRIGAGYVDEGIAVLTRLVDENPTHGTSALALLVTYQKAGDFASAIELGKQLVTLNPDNLSLINLLGVSHFLSEDFGSAGEQFQKCLAADPEFTPAAVNLAKVEMERGDIAAARQRLLALAVKKPDSGRVQLELSRIERAAGNDRDAIKYAEQAQRVAKTDVDVLRYLVDLYLEMGDMTRADDVSSSAATTELDNLEVQEIRSQVLIVKGEVGSARMTVRRMLDLAAVDDGWLVRIAALQSEIGDASDAAFSLANAINHAPDNRLAHVGLVELQLGMGRAAQALTSAKSAIERFPEDGELWLLRGEAEYLLADLVSALVSFDEAVARASISLAVVRGAHVLATQRKLDAAQARLGRMAHEPPGRSAGAAHVRRVSTCRGRFPRRE